MDKLDLQGGWEAWPGTLLTGGPVVDEVGPEVRPVEAGGGSLEHAGGGGVTSVEVAHHCRPERSRYDGTVVKHDDWSRSDETVTVGIIILNC